MKKLSVFLLSAVLGLSSVAGIAAEKPAAASEPVAAHQLDPVTDTTAAPAKASHSKKDTKKSAKKDTKATGTELPMKAK